MGFRKPTLPAKAYQEICLMKRRIEFLEKFFTEDCLETPALAMHLKEMYADVDMDLKTFSEKLAQIETGAPKISKPKNNGQG